MSIGVVFVASAYVERRERNGQPAKLRIDRRPVLAILRGGLAVRKITAREWQLLHRNSGAMLSYWPTRGTALAEADRLNQAGDWSKRFTVQSVQRDPVLRKLLRTAERVTDRVEFGVPA